MAAQRPGLTQALGRMASHLVPVRSISELEASVIERALSVASTSDDRDALLNQVRSLKVVSRCTCGCDSVGFHTATGEGGRMVADAAGETQDGVLTGILIWAHGEDLAELELYNFTEYPASLPLPSSIRPFK